MAQSKKYKRTSSEVVETETTDVQDKTVPVNLPILEFIKHHIYVGRNAPNSTSAKCKFGISFSSERTLMGLEECSVVLFLLEEGILKTNCTIKYFNQNDTSKAAALENINEVLTEWKFMPLLKLERMLADAVLYLTQTMHVSDICEKFFCVVEKKFGGIPHFMVYIYQVK